MTNERYKEIEQYFLSQKPNVYKSLLEQAKLLGTHLGTYGLIYEDLNSGITAKEIAYFLKMEAVASIHNAIIDTLG